MRHNGRGRRKNGEVFSVHNSGEDSSRVAWSELEELPKRHERVVNLSAFNAKQELCSIREWLGRLRGEVDARIVRLDVVLSNLKETGSGQGSREAGRIHKPKRTFKPKKKFWARKKRWVRKGMGKSSGRSPNEVEATSAPERPLVVENSIEREAVSNKQPGSMEMTGCLDSLQRLLAMGSPSKMTFGVQRRAIEDLNAPGPSRSASEGTRGATGGISGGLGQSVEGMGLSKEEGCTSYMEDTEVCLSSVDGAGEDAMRVLERKRGVPRELVGGLRLPAEFNTMSANGPGCIEAVEAGPKSEPKMLQVIYTKEAKPKMKRVISSGEGSSSSLEGPNEDSASCQNHEWSVPENAQGPNEDPVSSQYWEGTSPVIAQGPNEDPVSG